MILKWLLYELVFNGNLSLDPQIFFLTWHPTLTVNLLREHPICCIDLTILAIHGVKITKNQTPLTCFAWLFCKIIKQNVPGGYVLAPCIASILKNPNNALFSADRPLCFNQNNHRISRRTAFVWTLICWIFGSIGRMHLNQSSLLL